VSNQVRDSKKFKVIKCLKCSHIQLFPIPSKEDEKKFYDKELQNSIIKKDFKISELRKNSFFDVERRSDFVRKLVRKNQKILEIGSGDGFFLENMFDHGYNITGTEISKQRRQRSKKITKAKVLDLDFSEEIKNFDKFDVIVLFHVLEHIHEPKLFLKKISKILNFKGKIVVEVPNFNDFQIYTNKSYKNWQLQRAHIHYFTSKILKKIFKESGLKVNVSGIQRYSIENMFSWKITNKPQIDSPKFNLQNEFQWIESSYKKYLEKNHYQIQ
jgi:2-polyprenyl-3-methyl-5-hydroxy-6-metoxy-1,4-benzoquinol methylase